MSKPADLRRGTRVRILRTDIFDLYHRPKPWYGRVTKVDGGYVFVRSSRCKWVTELYTNEVEPT